MSQTTSTEKPQPYSRPNNFDSINKDFIQQIESLRETYPLIMLFITANDGKASQDLVEFAKEKGKEEKDEDGKESFYFSPEDAHKFEALEKNAEVATAATNIIPNSLFVSLISQFDSFIGKILKEIFYIKPEILNSSDKILTYSRLTEFNSIREARTFLIEKEVESVLRDSHTDHFVWLENKLGMTLRKDLPIWQEFIEITERRNLFVHCDGIVSNQYLSICKQNNVKHTAKLKIDDKLIVDSTYFEQAYRCLFEISVKLTQVIWRKLIPTDLENADYSLIDITFDLLKQKQLTLSNILLDFATNTLKKHHNEETKNTFIVNKALSFKLGDNIKVCNEIVASKDWSACSDKFKIAREALLDNHDNVAVIMKKIGNDGEIDKVSYKTWPLFSSFRETDMFTKTYEEIFEEEYFAIEAQKKIFDEILERVDTVEKKKTEYTNQLKDHMNDEIS